MDKVYYLSFNEMFEAILKNKDKKYRCDIFNGIIFYESDEKCVNGIMIKAKSFIQNMTVTDIFPLCEATYNAKYLEVQDDEI